MKVAVLGAGGRMGRAIVSLLREYNCTLVGAGDSPASEFLGKDAGTIACATEMGVAVSADLRGAVMGADCAIDFTTSSALPAVVAACLAEKVALVSGTTGLDTKAEAVLEKAASVIPVLSSPNMSLGVHVLALLTETAVRMLGDGYDVEIVEFHHRNKADAPSGTAKRLLQAVEAARPTSKRLSGREGLVGARAKNEVGTFAVRGGDVVGDHFVHLLGDGERLELVHRATQRDVFARGALAAAEYLCRQRAGRYTMRDVLASRARGLPD